ncbi:MULTISPECIES: TetR/AcrR family transcriptional regulator [Xenorhabdus]|uniref:TetR/AcrR family transcriptional regulator n=1 Tax=Xenorhabdus TaxID=626 RepID=UPI00064AB2A1|nr:MULTISPECIES: TetR/AcrR family transcriptional regulator [Xenorhabdus]KLU15470.1 TetR family transcriptional regulator [Xenorhabdus griffiniae]KOP34948.1 TetR family transcriptional regulator [Xenorhabdus sp. GDc328]
MSKKVSKARERILKAAHMLFYRDGIRATGIDRIIKESEVTKVTFYRHFPSKNDLILAFLDYRHEQWIQWFRGSLQANINRSSSPTEALTKTLAEWFNSNEFRGCAFINTVIEIGKEQPQVIPLIQAHKKQIEQVIASSLPPELNGKRLAQKFALLVEGAIIMMQRTGHSDEVLSLLQECLLDIAMSE